MAGFAVSGETDPARKDRNGPLVYVIDQANRASDELTMARPSKLTDEAEDRFIRAVGAGVPAEVAAVHAGFSVATLYRFKRGTSPRQVAFRERYRQAVASLHVRLAGTIVQAGLTDPRWALRFLERRDPRHWRPGRLDEGEDEASDGAPGPSEDLLVLDPALLDELVPRILAATRGSARRPGDDQVDLSSFEDDGGTPEPDDLEDEE
jgi:hypothetical protein